MRACALLTACTALEQSSNSAHLVRAAARDKCGVHLKPAQAQYAASDACSMRVCTGRDSLLDCTTMQQRRMTVCSKRLISLSADQWLKMSRNMRPRNAM